MQLATKILLSAMLCASAAAQKPAGATGKCNDGTFTVAASKDGACGGHKGVAQWYGAAPAASAQQAAPANAAATPAKHAPPQPAATAAAGGGPGIVWVNESTKVYHCFGDRYYGKTKEGKYMSEADAKKMGAHGARGATCGK